MRETRTNKPTAAMTSVAMGQQYQDVMDPTRVVVPVREKGTSVEVKVFWKSYTKVRTMVEDEEGKRKVRIRWSVSGMSYGGRTWLPLSLFQLNKAPQIGFVPTEIKLPTAKKAA